MVKSRAALLRRRSIALRVGAWRSLVAHLPWAQGVVGSNPSAPTILFNHLGDKPHPGSEFICAYRVPLVPTLVPSPPPIAPPSSESHPPACAAARGCRRPGLGLQMDSTGGVWLVGRGEVFKRFGGPGGIRTLDLFHAMEARSQLRHRPGHKAFISVTHWNAVALQPASPHPPAGCDGGNSRSAQ